MNLAMTPTIDPPLQRHIAVGIHPKHQPPTMQKDDQTQTQDAPAPENKSSKRATTTISWEERFQELKQYKAEHGDLQRS